MTLLIKIRYGYFLAFFWFCALNGIWAQTSVNCKPDTHLNNNFAFYKAQNLIYQAYLDQIGLGKFLSVNSIGVQGNQVTLYLEIENDYTDQKQKADYVISVWRELRTKFKGINGISLEFDLFLKLTHVMNINACQANIIIQDTYDTKKYLDTFFEFHIKYKDNSITKDSSGTKSTVHKYPITIGGTNKSSLVKSPIKPLSTVEASMIFNEIYTFFEQEFSQYKPKIEVMLIDLKNKNYSISIYPLSNQIVQSSDNSPICKWSKPTKETLICEWLTGLGFNCKDPIKENFTFTFYFKIEEGFRYLVCKLAGRYSQGKSNYKVIDVDEKSTCILEGYGNTIIPKLIRHLEKKF